MALPASFFSSSLPLFFASIFSPWSLGGKIFYNDRKGGEILYIPIEIGKINDIIMIIKRRR
jgi:hypothetical protein